MPEFISKLQYKDFEKGEYIEEKVRALEETLKLIKQYPWSEQRGSEISLTGPSVTIQDENGNYLKAALYFNGKYCVYYFDTDHHLYEYHTENLDDVYDQVSNFFNGLIDISRFEKQLFSIGSGKHFETRSFGYYINKTQMFFYLLLMLFFSCFPLLGTIAIFMFDNAPKLSIPIFLIFDAIFLGTCYFIVRMYRKTREMNLVISRGQSTFEFTQNDTTETYDKTKIKELNVYGYTGRSSRIFNLMELVFDNGSQVIIPGTLIGPFDFVLKFPGVQANYKGTWYLTSKFFWSYSK